MRKKARKKNMIIGIVVILALFVVSVVFTGFFAGGNIDDSELVGSINTFQSVDGDICEIESKPVVRLFSTTWCGHCQWIKETYDRVVQEYVDEGKIVAYHWELDTGDNTLTLKQETEIPESEMNIYRQFNPGGSIPTFVFGCKYYRIGNGYEREGNLELEEKEFRAIIEKLIASS